MKRFMENADRWFFDNKRPLITSAAIAFIVYVLLMSGIFSGMLLRHNKLQGSARKRLSICRLMNVTGRLNNKKKPSLTFGVSDGFSFVTSL